MTASGHATPLRAITIRPAKPSDLSAVARVHVSAFRGFFLTELGPRFLRAYYATILGYARGILLVAVIEGHVIGFVAGFVDPVQFYRRMAKRKRQFLLPVAWGVLRNPRLLCRVAGGSRRVMRAHLPQDWPGEVACELSSIAVDPSVSSRGVGQQLVARFLQCASEQDAKGVFLTTDAVGNDHVNGFYVRCGFRLQRLLHADGDRPMNQYVLELSKSEAASLTELESR